MCITPLMNELAVFTLWIETGRFFATMDYIKALDLRFNLNWREIKESLFNNEPLIHNSVRMVLLIPF